MSRRTRYLSDLIGFIVDVPSDCLTAVAVMKVEIEDDSSGDAVLAMGIGDGDVNVVDHAESAGHCFRAVMTRWSYADMDAIVAICQYSIDAIVY